MRPLSSSSSLSLWSSSTHRGPGFGTYRIVSCNAFARPVVLRTSLSEGFILLWPDRGPVGWRVWPSLFECLRVSSLYHTDAEVSSERSSCMVV
jgi:hypothetical protein